MRADRLLVLALLTLTLAACARRDDVLWKSRWVRRHIGSCWVSGVAGAEPERFRVTGGHASFRATLYNQLATPAEATLSGPGGDSTFALAPDGILPATADLTDGEYILTTPPSVFVGEPRLVVPAKDPKLLVLVVVDALRNDAIRPELAPRLLAEFASGQRYVTTIANASWTLPSLVSVFTANPLFDVAAPDGTLIAIPSGFETWAQALSARGFRTFGLVGNFSVHELNGFGAGFDTYVVPNTYDPDTGFEDAHALLHLAGEWLAAHRGEDSALYIHLMDTHEPYHDYSRPGLHPAPVAPITPLASRARTADDAERRQRTWYYEQGVRHVDRYLGEFVAGLPPQAVVAVTADHGEALGERGTWGHGLTVYDEALRVPLLLKGPGVPRGAVEAPVQLVDLVPTLLGLEGCPLPATMRGRSLLRGGSGGPIVSATWGAGPLRWSWHRDATSKVIVRTLVQGDLVTTQKVKMEEAVPLPVGAFGFDLARDWQELDPHPLAPDQAVAAADVFAATAGRLVPGLQVLVVGAEGPVTVRLKTTEPLTLAQAWSVTPLRVTVDGAAATAHADDGRPFALLAFACDRKPSLASLEADGVPVRSRDLAAHPKIAAPGVYVWWNTREASVQNSQQETIRRLRNLGYLQ